MKYENERETVAYFMRRLHRHGLTTAGGGNLSLRTTDDDVVALTPSKVDKAELRGDQVGLLQLDGTNLTSELVPSIESEMHLRILRACPDVQAIVHAHPVTAGTFAASDKKIDTHLVCESYAVVGEPVYVSYHCMGTFELAAAVADAAARANAVIMQNHGVLTTGATMLEACNRLEVLEVSARQTIIAKMLGGTRRLDGEKLKALDVLVGRA